MEKSGRGAAQAHPKRQREDAGKGGSTKPERLLTEKEEKYTIIKDNFMDKWTTDFEEKHPLLAGLGFDVLSLILFLLLIALIGCVHWNPGQDTYTGYVYSAEDKLTRTVGHLRFSQNAGEDSQPSFCVAKEHGDEIRKWVGKETKVAVTVPAGFKLAPFWDCAFEAQISELWEAEDD